MASGPPEDARTIAKNQTEYYRKQAHNAKLCNDITGIFLLVTTAATTLAAAFKAESWITAVLAAISFILVGLRANFNFQETWIRSGAASVEVLNTMESYDALPEELKNQEAKDKLLAQVHAIRNDEIHNWVAQYKVKDQ